MGVSLKIKKISFSSLEIPFKTEFSHASKSRSTTEAVVVCVESESGLRGYGEGCPRDYVTQEDLKSTIDFLEEHVVTMREISSLGDLISYTIRHKSEIDANPAAFCAVEVALLDLLAKVSNISVEKLLGVSDKKTEFEYTAVLGLSSKFKNIVHMYKKMDFKHFKVKLSGKKDLDIENLKSLYEIVPTLSSLRVDANNFWQSFAEASKILSKFEFRFEGVEEPLKARDFSGLEKLAKHLGARVILDESFTKAEDFNFLNDPSLWVINLRVSKMGGLLRSLKIIEEAQQRSISIVVGSQVGETSLLTRAGLVASRACKNNLVGQEGAFGTYLLKEDITLNSIQFGIGGTLSHRANQPGLGLEIIKNSKYLNFD